MSNIKTKQSVILRRRPTLFSLINSALGWNRSSYFIMSTFFLVVSLIVVVWWPLADEYISQYDPDYPFWLQFDWLLLGIFITMSLLIMAGADIKKDILIVFVGLFGGLAIESWGTQTNLWSYYTMERPPLWIIPAWPIASLSIDRLVRIMNNRLPEFSPTLIRSFYWISFSGFYLLMLLFIRFTFDKTLTWMALLTCTLLIITPTNYRIALLTFIAGSVLGYFLERWGTTRACWIYYTHQTPPVFAVFAHGLAAVSFWRASLIIKRIFQIHYSNEFIKQIKHRFTNEVPVFFTKLLGISNKIDVQES